MPRGRFPATIRDSGPWPRISTGSHVAGSIANLLGHDIDVRAQEGDADGALVSCRALLNASRAIGDEPQLWSQILRTDLQQKAILKMERTLAQGEPTEATLEALQRLLADDDRLPALLIALRGERALADLMLEGIGKGHHLDLYFQAKRGTAAIAPLPRNEELGMIASGSLKAQRVRLLRFYTDLVEAAKLPPQQMNARVAQVMTNLGASSQPAVVWAFLNPMQVRRAQQNNGLVRSAVVALAAERYRRQHGAWPPTLDALVPAFLPEVPVDPHDGKRLRYRRLTAGVVIYSVGQDMGTCFAASLPVRSIGFGPRILPNLRKSSRRAGPRPMALILGEGQPDHT